MVLAARTDNEVGDMSNQPVQEIRRGQIRASIWVDQTDQGVKHKVIFTRAYKTGHHWHDTATFGRDDLLLISQVAELAHQWILQQTLS
jgi:hypothetical protein